MSNDSSILSESNSSRHFFLVPDFFDISINNFANVAAGY